jgi:hypothetical protein
MASGVRAFAAGMAMMTVLFCVRPATADPVQPLTLVLGLFDHARVPKDVLARAKAEASRIYRALGVRLVWRDAFDSSVRPPVSVNITSTPFGAPPPLPDSLAIKAADSRVLGVAPGHKDRVEREVWAFYERIEDTAPLLGLDSGLLLGHVIAHEIGHVLLPYDSHSPTGLMRAGWDKNQAANAVFGSLKFTRGQSALIRRSVTLISSSPTLRVAAPEDRVVSDRPTTAR